jgi:glycerate dehydrogenase
VAIKGPEIVVLDGYTLAPSPTAAASRDHDTGLSWAALEELGRLTVYDRTPHDRVADRAAQAPIVLTNKTVLKAETLARLPRVRYIGVLATGVNVVDVVAATERNVVVTNVPGYSTDSVAQHVFALLFEIVNQTSAHDRAVHEGAWTRGPDFSLAVASIRELAGKTLGVVGMGAIGRRVAAIGHALGMNVAATGRPDAPTRSGFEFPVEWMTFDALLSRADVLTLHCPLTEQTRGLLDADRLARMKPTAIFINTGRGPLVDELALAQALRDGIIHAAGLDVLSTEPPKHDHPLLTAPRCVITPHVAWASIEAKRRLLRQAAENVRAFLNHAPINVVNQQPRPGQE